MFNDYALANSMSRGWAMLSRTVCIAICQHSTIHPWLFCAESHNIKTEVKSGMGKNGQNIRHTLHIVRSTLLSVFQPAHVKACFLGASLTIPVTDGRLNVGTWQVRTSLSRRLRSTEVAMAAADICVCVAPAGCVTVCAHVVYLLSVKLSRLCVSAGCSALASDVCVQAVPKNVPHLKKISQCLSIQ